MIKTFQNDINSPQDAANPKRIRSPEQLFSMPFQLLYHKRKSRNYLFWPSTRLHSPRYYLHFRFIIVFYGADMK